MTIILTLPITKALDVGYDQPTTGVGTSSLRRESLDGETKKATHEAVDFEHPAQGPHHCSECAHYRARDDCERVAPPIDPGDWCRLFARKD